MDKVRVYINRDGEEVMFKTLTMANAVTAERVAFDVLGMEVGGGTVARTEVVVGDKVVNEFEF